MTNQEKFERLGNLASSMADFYKEGAVWTASKCTAELAIVEEIEQLIHDLKKVADDPVVKMFIPFLDSVLTGAAQARVDIAKIIMN